MPCIIFTHVFFFFFPSVTNTILPYVLSHAQNNKREKKIKQGLSPTSTESFTGQFSFYDVFSS